MKIKQFFFNPFQENTYLIFDDSNEAIIIDAGCCNPAELQQVENFVQSHNLIVKQLVNTHCHIDHVMGVSALKQLYGVNFGANGYEASVLGTLEEQSVIFGVEIGPAPKLDVELNDGDTVLFGTSAFEVIHTPGHTKGGICFYSKNSKVLLSGDTLFSGSIGRTDLPGGSYDEIIQSINTKLFTLPDDVKVFPGHGGSTSIGFEKQHNPFFN